MTGSVFSRYFDVFSAKPGSPDADRHGRFAVPGEETFELSKGRVRIYYDEARSWLGDDTFRAPRDLEVSIAEADSGTVVPIRFKLLLGGASAAVQGFVRTYVGRVEIPHDGRYRVRAHVEEPPPHDPHLSLGA